MHRHWWSRREVVLVALALAGESPKTCERVMDCGKFATFERANETGELRIRGSKCRHRFCKRCAQATNLNVADNVRDFLGTRRGRLSMMCFTLKHNTAPLADQRKRLYKAFKRLRTERLWTDNVAGGAAFFQVHKSKKDNMWHVHFHTIVQHRYIPQEELSALWLKITRDSFNVDIRRIDSFEDAARECARYVSNPVDKDTTENPHDLAAIMVATKGCRLCFPFGDWKGLRFHAKRPELEALTWTQIDYVGNVLERADRGDEESKALLAEYFRQKNPATGPPGQSPDRIDPNNVRT